MNKRLAGCTAAALTACLTLGSLSTAYAATDLALAGVGSGVKKEEAAKETEKKAEPKETEAKKAEVKETEAAKKTKEKTAETEKAPETEAPLDRSMVDTTGFAKAEDYINVRAEGYAEADVVGVLTNLDSVYIEDVDAEGWYKVRSGNVEGYVAGYLIATGAEAEELAGSAGYTYAQVGTESLNVRADASEDSEVVDMAGPDTDLEVVEDLGDWVKVVTPDGVYGYVKADYVSTQTVYPTGETVQEQAEREEAEYIAAVAQQEAEAAAYAQAYAEAEASMVSSMSDDIQALYDAYLAAQEAAMHPVDEADASAKADAAVAAYNAYIAAANGAGVSAQDTGAAAETGASSGSSSSEIEALYQAYLAAQEAALHPVDEADALEKANAAIAAYNAYLAALGSGQSVASVASVDTGASSAASVESADDGEDDGYAVYDDGEEEDDEEVEYVDVDSSADEAVQAPAASGIGAEIAAYATQFVGNPYVYGGASLTNGADCSGFTMAVFSHFGIGLPHNAAAQSGCGTQVSLSDLQPGDLLFYDNGGGIGHVTLYIGGGQVVHASSPETGIKISSYDYRSPVCAVRCF